MASPVSNNKVGFKVGTQANMNTIINNSSATPGMFYLTSDTHRLYVGNSDNTVSAVNEGILTVSTTSQLTPSINTVGHFYYVEDINALVIGSGRMNGETMEYAFMQINAQSPDTKISSVAFTGANDTDANASYVIVTETVNSTDGSSKTGKFIIKGDNGLTVAMDSNTTVGTDSIPTVKISADPLSLSTSAGTGSVNINLTSTSGSTNQSVTLKQGTNVTLSRDSQDGSITINAVDNKVNAFSINPKSVTDSVSGETTYQNGFVETITNSADGSQATANFDPTVQVGVGATSQIHFLNGNAILPVYTATEIDNIMKGLNAMTYRGIIGSDTGAVATGINATTNYPMNGDTPLTVKVGDTFMIGTSGDITYNNVHLEPYSLLIARGTEDASGNITSNLVYDYVKDTKSINTTYTLGWNDPESNVNNPSIVLKDNNSNVTGEVEFVGGTAINVTASQTPGTGLNHNEETITITHNTVSRTDVAPGANNNPNVYQSSAGANTSGNNPKYEGAALTIPVIVEVNSDTEGHVTGIKTTNYVVQDTNARVSNVAFGATSVYQPSASPTTNVGVIQNSVSDLDSSGAAAMTKTGKMTLSSDTLSIAATNNLKEADGVGNNLNGLSINLVWGTF